MKSQPEGSAPECAIAFADGDVPKQELSADALVLLAQGHEEAMPRNFGFWSTLSLGFSITNSWVGYSGTFGVCLAAGAGPTVVYALLAATVACSIITAGLAELASAFPSSGGQYHFSFMVSPPKYAAPISFSMGWLSVIAWGMQTASAPIMTAQIIMYLINQYIPSFEAQPWQTYLLYVVICVFCALVVIFCSKQIPQAEVVFLTMTLVGFVVYTILVLVRSSPKQPAKVVFTEWSNITGWNDGFAFLLAVSQAMFTYLSVDSVTHIAEEMPNPGKGVPRAMGLTMVIGATTVIPWTLALLFATSDLQAVAVSGVPIVTAYQQALRSKDGATVLAAWLMMIFLGASISGTLTCSRLVWAFARDNGLPYSRLFDKVHPRFEAPINSTILVGAFLVAYGAIYCGSLNAFNSFISLSILGLNITYMVPQAIACWRGRSRVLPDRQVNLGPWFGPFCNIFSTLWVVFTGILFCFPTFIPVEAETMNYLSVVSVGVAVLILAMWFGGKRKTFTGPQVILQGVDDAGNHVSVAVTKTAN